MNMEATNETGKNPGCNLDERHQDTAKRIATVYYAKVRAAMKASGKTAGMSELFDALLDAMSEGLAYALEAEARAWDRSTQLEDALIEVCRHAPDGEIVKWRKLAGTTQS